MCVCVCRYKKAACETNHVEYTLHLQDAVRFCLDLWNMNCLPKPLYCIFILTKVLLPLKIVPLCYRY